MDGDVRHDEQHHTFVLSIEGGQAVLHYQPLNGDTVDFQSTFVPPALRGRGVGHRVVVHALEWARDRKLRVVPSCWFVSDVVALHPEYRALLAT
jgi:predicted GNAT family acetyltransferase